MISSKYGYVPGLDRFTSATPMKDEKKIYMLMDLLLEQGADLEGFMNTDRESGGPLHQPAQTAADAVRMLRNGWRIQTDKGEFVYRNGVTTLERDEKLAFGTPGHEEPVDLDKFVAFGQM